jgi:hypothetical protein
MLICQSGVFAREKAEKEAGDCEDVEPMRLASHEVLPAANNRNLDRRRHTAHQQHDTPRVPPPPERESA